MALATTCPNCNTSFRVVPDQLALRRGMVRCGVCQNVFSGMANLKHVDEILRPRPAAAPVAAPASTPVARPADKPPSNPPASPEGDRAHEPVAPGKTGNPDSFPQTDLRTAFFLPETVFGPATGMAQSGTAEDPPTRIRTPGPDTRIRWAREQAMAEEAASAEGMAAAVPTIIEAPHHEAIIDVPAPAIGSGPDSSPRSSVEGKNRRRASSSSTRDRSEQAIAYFEPDASRVGFSSRAVAFGWAVCLLALVALIVQLTLGARHFLASRMPVAKAPLEWLGAPLGLSVEAPLDLQALTIESFELQSTDIPGRLNMSALLRNRSDYVVRWPALEIALTDSQGAMLIRKALLATDYLPPSMAGKPQQGQGIGARAEWPMKLTLELRDISPSGYSVTLFYP